jgi:hypothetical protein
MSKWEQNPAFLNKLQSFFTDKNSVNDVNVRFYR